MIEELRRDDIIAHAHDWIAAWNRRDLGAVLAAYADEASFRSPFARTVTGSSLVEGKPAMASYWQKGLDRLETLDFTFVAAVCDVEQQKLVVHYLAALNGPPKRACEIFHFENGIKVYAEALYGDVHDAAPPAAAAADLTAE